MSDFKFSCPHCGQHISCDTGYSGHDIPCPSCQKTLTVPAASEAAPAAPPAPRARLTVQAASPPPAPHIPAAAAGLVYSHAAARAAKARRKKLITIAGVAGGVLVAAVAGVLLLAHFKGGRLAEAIGFGSRTEQAAPSDGLAPEDILERMKSKYASMSSYSGQGSITVTIDASEMIKAMTESFDSAMGGGAKGTVTTSEAEQQQRFDFSMSLQRPNQFRIEWNQPESPDGAGSGAVWSAAEGIYLMPTKQRYHRMRTPQVALGAAAGASGGAAQTIPAAFLGMHGALVRNLLSEIITPTRGEDAVIGSDDCYYITGIIQEFPIQLWIRKSDFLLKQKSHDLNLVVQEPELSDEEARMMLAELGSPATPDRMAALRQRLQGQAAAMAAFKIRGTVVETHQVIEPDAPLGPESFTYSVPAGTRVAPFRLN